MKPGLNWMSRYIYWKDELILVSSFYGEQPEKKFDAWLERLEKILKMETAITDSTKIEVLELCLRGEPADWIYKAIRNNEGINWNFNEIKNLLKERFGKLETKEKFMLTGLMT